MTKKSATSRSRKLLTILAADVAEYSRLMQDDEAFTLDQLAELRAVMDAEFSKKNGRIVNSAGDSVLVRFDSPLQAVEAAIAVQSAHEAHNRSVPKMRQLRFRMGINLGEVEEQSDGDLLGHGVNVAARLEQLSAPGGICVSESVFQHVDGKLQVSLTKVGEQLVKNMDQPLQVYTVSGSGLRTRTEFQTHVVKAMRSPFVQLGLAIAVLLAIGLSASVWWRSERSQPPIFNNLQAFLDSNPSSDAMLEFFDLVTTGQFDGANYHVIRTWGASLEELDRIGEVLGGYLVAIGSEAENDFVYNLSLEEEGHWFADEGQFDGPMIGLFQAPGSPEPDGGWEWRNGDPVDYLNWRPGGPTNWEGNQWVAAFRNHKSNSVPANQWGDLGSIRRSVIFEVPHAP
ncbi:adenylate/guanylate cyclase domain-containing protein [Ruegeria atlantica]|uniref:Adenylate cyclase n=1 Tax=Ruegeria atlantica TaxID=81569 RepID=A0ABX1WE37_9RHOB|nr:adenylate/guanylate cyclase domain-containing protein [Ruegeria atlantica]NOD31499.1 hypothetical protein [Ruegeria atlantica]